MISVSGTGYRELFAQSALRGLAVADVCARLPQGMVSLTLLPVATVCAVGYALALAALLAGALAAAPAGVLIGTATAAGLVNPPLSPGLRSLWSAHTQARLTQTAFALDAAVFDLAYITGPVLASALATGLAPRSRSPPTSGTTTPYGRLACCWPRSRSAASWAACSWRAAATGCRGCWPGTRSAWAC
jgi:hypothetical protein